MAVSSALVSVIVPVYNAEATLHRCVESIINQTYKNLEIILVNDGSRDKSGAICDAYAEKDNRVKVIHQENGGISAARNAALDIMTGQYIVFVDSDDWIELSMVSDMITVSSDTRSDIAICAGYKVRDGEDYSVYNYYYPTGTVMDAKSMTKAALTDRLSTYAANALYSSNLWKRGRFPVGRLYEDLATIYKVISIAERICFVEKPLYNYYLHSGSITASKGPYKSYWIFVAKKEHYEFAKEQFPEIADECAGNAAQYALSVCFYYYSTKDVAKEAFREAYEFLNKHKQSALHYKRHPKTRRMLMKLFWYARPIFWLGCKMIYLKNVIKKK